MSSKVRIQHVIAELDISSKDLFNSISQKAANFINRNIPKLIDQVFQDLDPNVDYIIESIEIDLGKIKFENISDLNQLFQQKFKDVVSNKLSTAQVDKSFKFERGILDFIEHGKFPWWMDQTAAWERQFPKKLSKNFLDKISSLLSVSKEHFFRLNNLLGQNDLDQLLKHLLKEDHIIYAHSLRLLDKLVKKTKQKWVSPDFDRKALQYYLVSEFSMKRIDKKEILFQFLNRFASQTRQELSSIISLSVSGKKESNSDLDQILKSISQENLINQRPKNINPFDAISILINYFEKGYDQIPSGYSDLSLLKGLLRKVLDKNKNDFIFALKSMNLKESPIIIQRFLFLLDDSKSYLSAFFSSDQNFQWISEVITLIESSQVINLFERQTTSFKSKNLNHVLVRLVVEENITDLSHQVLMEKLLRIMASDYNINYSNLIKELFLSFNSGSQQSESFSILENIYVREVIQKIIFKPRAKVFFGMKDTELANQLSFFQRQSLDYFKKLFSHSSFKVLYQNTFHTSNELLANLFQTIQKIQVEDFANLSLALLRKMSTLTKTPFSLWVEGVVKFMHQKKYLNRFDHQLLAKFTREQYEDENEIRTIFRYTHQKKLNPQQEEIITFLLKLFSRFEKNKNFKIKFSDVELFEVFLVNFFQSASETNLNLLLENAFSQITIHTQIPYKNIVSLVLEGLKSQHFKTPLDDLIITNYEAPSVDNLEQDQQLIGRFLMYLDKKSIPFLHYKRILFLFDHLDDLLNKNSSYKSAFKKPENFFDFLAQEFPSTSNSYAINLKLLDRLAKKIKLPFDILINSVLNSIKAKIVKTWLDFEFLANFDATDPSQDKLLFKITEKQNLDHLRKSVFRFYFTTFLNFKNQKKYKSIFKDDLDLAQFVFNQLKLNQNESFELMVPLLFSAFGKRIQTSVSTLFLVTAEIIISEEKTDELSQRLLSKIILILLETHSPKFNFGSSPSRIKNADDLMLSLSKHKKIYPNLLQQLVYFPNFLSTLKLDSYRKSIRQLIEGSNIRFEWIENSLKESLQSIKGNLNTRIRFLILKILFDAKSINSEMEFQKILREYLIRHDPHIIKEGIFNQEFKTIATEKDESDKSSIKKIIDLLSKQKDEFISPFEENSFEKNQFDYLLQYKNDILISKNQDDSRRIQNELDDFESILSDTDSFLFFLITYANDLEILLAFTELVLSKENEKISQLRLDQLSKKFLRLEQLIIELHNDTRFSNLNKKTFKILLRAFLFKNIGINKKVSNFSISDFMYGFLEHLSRERYLSLRAINDITFFKETDVISQEINLALSVFTDRGIYYSISKRVRDEIYFKDLSVAIIKYQQLPDWALSKTFTVSDAWTFVISKVEDQDYEFTSKLIKELSVTEGFLKSIEEKSTPFFVNLFRQIQNPETDYDLSIKFQGLVSYFSKYPWNTKDQTDTVLSSFFLRSGLWKGMGLIQLSDKISDFIKDRSEREPDQLKQEVRQALKLSDTFFSFKKLSQLGTEEKIELIKYFFEMGQLPKEINFDQVKIKKYLKDFLLQNTQPTKKLWKDYIGQPEAVSNILKLISEAQLIQSIKSSFFLKSKDHELFGTSIFVALKDSGADKKRLSNLLKILRQFIIGKAFKENTFITFSSNLQKEDKPIYILFIKKLIDMQSPNDWDPSSELGQFLNKIEQKEAFEEVIVSQEKIDSERLEYYVEFGSTQFDDVLLGIDDLYQLFKKLLKRDRLLIKKRLHQWGNSKNKIRRIIKFHPKEDQILLLDHIHIELSSYLSALDQIMVDEFNTSLPMALGLENWEGLIAYNFGYWSSKNLIMYSLKDLIQMFVHQLLKQLRVSKEDMAHILSVGLKNNSKTIKNQLNEWISQLESPSIKNKKTEQISDIEDLDKTGGLFIKNAGLILLWPFLSRLFDKLNLLEDKNFIDETAQQKAILLTEYLVTDNTDFQESSLALNKLICGAPIDTYIDVNLSLEPFELKLCESLLKSVIDNWEKINNSSISTLRETFLIREGVLVKSNTDFKLNVQKKPFDVLLTTLPWTISMIQTSFMKNRIIVTWV